MSVILVGRDGLQTLAPILTCLAEQTIADMLEVVMVVPEAHRIDEVPEPWAQAFHTCRCITVRAIGNRGVAAAAGVLQATAPIIGFTENHCFPDPNWAEELCGPHDAAYVGVAPVVLNANPENLWSQAVYGSGYAIFADRDSPEEVDVMPMHNTSYRRDALEPLGNELSDLLSHEGRLQRRLADAGGRFLLHPRAKTRHVNEGTPTLVLSLNFFNGWRYGGRRGKAWSPLRRMAYALGFPLLSINVMRETLRRLDRCPEPPAMGPRLFALIWLQSLSHCAGEAVGYLTGSRDTFDFVDLEEFMILERIGNRPLQDTRLADFVTHAVPVSRNKGWGI